MEVIIMVKENSRGGTEELREGCNVKEMEEEEVVNYALGFKFGKEIATDKLKVSEAAFKRASYTFTKWGKWSLFLCWVPIIGDPITLVAGVLRSPFWFFILAVTLSKTARYAALLYVLV